VKHISTKMLTGDLIAFPYQMRSFHTPLGLLCRNIRSAANKL